MADALTLLPATQSGSVAGSSPGRGAREGPRRALVVGASGLLGENLCRRIAATPGWHLTTLSRRPPTIGGGGHVALDLRARDDCLAHARAFADVTHVFFCARELSRGYGISVDANGEMLVNLLDALAEGAPSLAHVQLMHGLKWYGTHVGPVGLPARESDPAHADSSFYRRQQEELMRRSVRAGWSWSTIRPHFLCAFATGSPSNLVLMLGTYASVLRELGEDLWFPGSEAAFDAVTGCVDIDLVTSAMLWAASSRNCADNAFNIGNGDFFRWRDLWPKIAAAFGMRPGPVRPTDLPRFMADKGPAWDRIVACRGLRPLPFAGMADWHFAHNNVFGLGWDVVPSLVKAHRFGFHEVVDTEEMFARLFARYRAERILP
ncbi:SDR family oxidoreductase [Xanthobacter dioxanivorans]|uniref:SDR family oxidoreductase n=1 Tax=Xanthobacter dioxanivorans TaxID=2528964 RepID=A0A974SI41_9HYPH|nr:SDR family oxidoreductase [Xanthobacter dioxanivorans]QRG06310.1 SDR family oxidoreductase [Xanthobacter dioxanivorans]